MIRTLKSHRSVRRILGGIAAALLVLATAGNARALNIGYYDMCYGEGPSYQATPITNAGHTAVNLFDLTPAELATVDVLFINNCENTFYAQEYLDHLGDIDAAVASGKVLILHDRFVDLAETILPGGSTFDIQRHPLFPDPNNEAKDINVLDPSSPIVNGPAGVITDTSLDGGNYSDHGFAIAGSLPGTAKLVLSTNDPTHIVTFVYTYGSGAVMYSSIPLDFYLGGSSPVAFSTIYALNIVDYGAYLVGSCGNGVTDPGEDCDFAGDNGVAGSCCTAGCGFVTAGTECRAGGGECDPAEVCSGASATCPAPAVKPAGAACTDDGDQCTRDECDGAGACEHPDKPDTDVDGTCDEHDDCTNVAGGQNFVATKPRPNVSFTKINTDPVAGNDGLKVSGEFALAVGSTFGDVNPAANGVRVLVENGSGTARVDQVLPSGAYGGRGTRGWKVNGAGTVWSYTDGTAAPLSGIKKMKIVDRSKSGPRRVRVSVTGVRATYPVAGGDAPLHAVVVFGNQADAEAGLCGESNFTPSSCKLNGLGNTLTCK